ncbi:MAG: deacetylase [Spirochaetia bacterium]|jgi:hypothetical protein|nr:deacetylase [Spirochaetia bacterium]
MNSTNFIITVDTEGDNQWDTSQKATTKNAKFIPRFQDLSNTYGFFPTWLVDYEMAQNPFLVEFLGDKLHNNLCEIGMHPHAWSTPPEISLEKTTNCRDYLIEYPVEIMEMKLRNLKDLLEEKFCHKITSHRSGRWTINQQYFDLLEHIGITADCSVTPHINWTRCQGATGIPGSDFRNSPESPFYPTAHILEIPMTIRYLHQFDIDGNLTPKNLLRGIKHLGMGKFYWLRPDSHCQTQTLKHIIKKAKDEKSDYVMFMIHSSELMPGGSPSFSDKATIENLYQCVENVFQFAQACNFKGITLSDYAHIFSSVNKLH